MFQLYAAKSLQLCPTLCDPTDGSPPGSPVPGILQARTLEWVAISFSNAWKGKVKVKSLSCLRLLTTPWTAAHQAPPSMGFSRQEYWSGLPFNSINLCKNSCWRYICIIHSIRERWADNFLQGSMVDWFHALEKEMATHSSVLAWRIPGMAEPGGLPSMGSHRVGHDWSDLAAAAEAESIQFSL